MNILYSSISTLGTPFPLGIPLLSSSILEMRGSAAPSPKQMGTLLIAAPHSSIAMHHFSVFKRKFKKEYRGAPQVYVSSVFFSRGMYMSSVFFRGMYVSSRASSNSKIGSAYSPAFPGPHADTPSRVNPLTRRVAALPA